MIINGARCPWEGEEEGTGRIRESSGSWKPPGKMGRIPSVSAKLGWLIGAQEVEGLHLSAFMFSVRQNVWFTC